MLEILGAFLKVAFEAAFILEKIGSFLGFNTEELKKFTDDLNAAANASFQAGDKIENAFVNELFNPTNNINNEINIELNQDEKGVIKVAAVVSNQRSTVKTFNTGIMTPVFS